MNIYSLTLNPIMMITKNILTATYEKISSYLPFLSNLQTKELNQPSDSRYLENIDNYKCVLGKKSNKLLKKFNFSNLNNFNNYPIEIELCNPHFKLDTNSYYFADIKETSIIRKYLNDWNELREFIGYNDFEINNNEIIIYTNKPKLRVYATNYNVLRVMSGMYPHPAFSN